MIELENLLIEFARATPTWKPFGIEQSSRHFSSVENIDADESVVLPDEDDDNVIQSTAATRKEKMATGKSKGKGIVFRLYFSGKTKATEAGIFSSKVDLLPMYRELEVYSSFNV